MMGRLIRQLTGQGKREARADELVREHRIRTAPERRALKARVNALERLVDKLKEDTAQWP